MPQDWKSSVHGTFCLGFQAVVCCLFKLTQSSRKSAITQNTCTSARLTVKRFLRMPNKQDILIVRKENPFERWKVRPGLVLTPAADKWFIRREERTLLHRRWTGCLCTGDILSDTSGNSVSSDVSGSSLCGSGIISNPNWRNAACQAYSVSVRDEALFPIKHEQYFCPPAWREQHIIDSKLI